MKNQEMNRIEKRGNEFILTLIDGREFTLKIFVEKKKNSAGDINEVEHLVIPKEIREVCGRTYVRLSMIEKNGILYFENKEYHREGLSNGGWKSRLTDEEKAEYEKCEKRMEEIKRIAMTRPAKELTELEKVEKELAKLQAKRAMLLQNS